MITLYTVVMVLLLVGAGIWVILKVVAVNKHWDKAYLLRLADLANTLPPSEVFPVILRSITFPRVGSGSSLNNSHDQIGILYVSVTGKVVMERVAVQAQEPFYQVQNVFNLTPAQLKFRSDQPEATFPGKGSYVLIANEQPYLIGDSMVYSTEHMNWHKNTETQEKIITELKELGVN